MSSLSRSMRTRPLRSDDVGNRRAENEKRQPASRALDNPVRHPSVASSSRLVGRSDGKANDERGFSFFPS
eukprot:753875-Hanusia_phi.AAC.4